jgi:hypothetical protein
VDKQLVEFIYMHKFSSMTPKHSESKYSLDKIKSLRAEENESVVNGESMNLRPSSTRISLAPTVEVVITGRPHPIASITTLPNSSI